MCGAIIINKGNEKLVSRHCKRCQTLLKSSQKKYCCKQCFYLYEKENTQTGRGHVGRRTSLKNQSKRKYAGLISEESGNIYMSWYGIYNAKQVGKMKAELAGRNK